MNQLSYDVFLSTITEVNKISGHFLDTNGKQLVFAVKKGTDSSFLWKATVRIACVKIGKKYALKRYDQFAVHCTIPKNRDLRSDLDLCQKVGSTIRSRSRF